MAVVINGLTGITTNPGTLLSGSTIGVGGTTPSASGAGITFPATQSASTDANTLDDYEEGTWTPTIGGTGITYSVQVGTYTKIGNLVLIQGNITLTGGTPASPISGLPFTTPNVNDASFGMGVKIYNSNGGITYSAGRTEISAYIPKNTAQITLEAQGSGAGSSSVTISNTSQIFFAATYRTT